jgi:hypothetical protein
MSAAVRLQSTAASGQRPRISAASSDSADIAVFGTANALLVSPVQPQASAKLCAPTLCSATLLQFARRNIRLLFSPKP